MEETVLEQKTKEFSSNFNVYCLKKLLVDNKSIVTPSSD